MRGILLTSRVRSLQIKPSKPSELIASSDNGSDSYPFADHDLDKDEDQQRRTGLHGYKSACAKASVFAFD